MEDITTVIKRICFLAFLTAFFSCNTTKFPKVSSKLEPIFKTHEKIYKQQNSWRHVQWEYKYSRKVIDSIFKKYDLQGSEEFYIITYTDELANYSFEIRAVDKNVHLQYYNGYNNLSVLPNEIEMTHFKDLYNKDFIEFVNSKTQEELEDCSKKNPTENSDVVLFTYYKKDNIIVKRFETCDYSGYYNWEIPTED